MTKRGGTILLGAVVAAVLVPYQTSAQTATEVPETVQIEDIPGDANYLNSQDGLLPLGGDQSTAPADLTISDLLKVWFSNDATNISVHIQTEGPPPSGNASYIYRVRFNPGDDETGCLWFEAIIEGPTYVGESFARLRPVCADVDPFDAEFTIEELADGTGLITVTIARSVDPAFDDGAIIAAPRAEVRNNWGAEGGGRATAPAVDDTKVGSDYTITAPEPAKKGCKKGKGKKKGC